ncbi:amidohydrolase family protein [Acidobacteriota bacterium]
MKIALVTSFLILLVSASCIEKEEADLAITNVSIIDVKGGPTKTHMTVLIKGNRIIAISDSNKIRIKESTDQIDGTDKFLIPGLWDMHVHWYKEDYLPLFIANGVVGIRIMWGYPVHFEWREKSQKDELLCPRMVISSPIIDGPDSGLRSIIVSNKSEARIITNLIEKAGYDFIKVYTDLTPNVFFAIADRSKKLGIPFAGHLPWRVTLLEASNAGQKSIEHLISEDLYLACSSLEDEIHKEWIENIQNNIPFNRTKEAENKRKIKESYDDSKAKSLFASLRENNTWFCPTIIVGKNKAFPEAMLLAYDSLFKYLPLDFWNSKKGQINNLIQRNKNLGSMRKNNFQEELDTLYLMHQNGVKFIAGTDTYVPYCPPGFCLHAELELFVEAGFSPLEALQTATINAALFNGSEDSLGTVEVDKIADLVLLDANPLDNIQNTKKINAVIFNGKPFRKSELQNMLNDIEALGNK